MELILTFDNLKAQTIPIDYQYYLSSWMYKVMEQGDAKYAAFLHDQGHRVSEDSHKIFKLFCFSWLQMEHYKIDKIAKTMTIEGNTLKMHARFHVEESLKTFVKGLFQDQNLTIKNGFDQSALFAARSIDMRDVEIVDGKAIIRANSPIVISRKQANGNDAYLRPDEEGYTALFYHNLLDKYKASGGNVPDDWQPETWQMNVKRPERIRMKGMKIKPNTQDIKVIGYTYDFELIAPPEIIRTGLLAGFGKHCAQGFGFGEVMSK